MKKIVEKHPLAVRWNHWINFPVLTIMIWSGFMIYWANDVYRLGWKDKTLLKFFPDSFYNALHLTRHLADGMSMHFVFMWIFILNGIIYVSYTIFSGEWKYLVPNKHSFREALEVILHDLGISKKPLPKQKFNGAQKIAYTSVIIMGLGSVLTGLAIYKPIQFSWLLFLLGGYSFSRIIHFTLTIGYVLFFIIHIAQVIRAGWSNFQAMVTGFEVEDVGPLSQAKAIPLSPGVEIPLTQGVDIPLSETEDTKSLQSKESGIKISPNEND